MSATPEAFNDLLTKKKAFANPATINTAKGRLKDKSKAGEVRVIFAIAPDRVQTMG